MPAAVTEKRALPLAPPPPPLAANGKALYYRVWTGTAPWASRESRKAAGSSYYVVDGELPAVGRKRWGGCGTVGTASLQSGACSSGCPRLGRACRGTLASLPARGAAGSPVLEGRPKPGQGQGGGQGDRDLDRPSLIVFLSSGEVRPRGTLAVASFSSPSWRCSSGLHRRCLVSWCSVFRGKQVCSGARVCFRSFPVLIALGVKLRQSL